ncbi:putative alpha-1,6-mannanase (GH76 family) [Arthrobacter pigmenti]|uniref:Putative alpha-1,6-mannanase (GH76 family) n=1 Tax=Arthrobacter pigmenti TaxID=271432 RepID=A0A846RDR8_9MICC|nr:glycoside hydrolase family 76 protein [Arthrobacter pigmenti]NJC21153.1 putative alpha-1,6-mannanase (GH76 family) [Arthrobacter pigmenti]
MSTAKDAGARASAAAGSVTSAFGHRLLGLPGTHLGAVRVPKPIGGPWHYWWQAHYLDCLLDAAEREGNNDDGAAHRTRARRLLRTIRLRNGGRWTNAYYDDMAWLSLAALRSADLARNRPLTKLTRVLASAHSPDLGGGLFWNTSRDFKNTPATGPTALYFALIGRQEEAQRMVDWLFDRLLDPRTGLLFDGLRMRSQELVTDIYTYNQGPVLGALLSLGGERNVDRAEALIGAVSQSLVQSGGALRTHGGGGDGGLFTGILVRYLALAAASPLLSETSRSTARTLITATADALWEGRGELGLDRRRRRTVLVFPEAPYPHAGTGAAELSTQLQAWMVFEAAYRVSESADAEAASGR